VSKESNYAGDNRQGTNTMDMLRNREMATLKRESGIASIIPYILIARTDHWFKNVFMLVGVVLAYFYYGGAVSPGPWWVIPLAFFSTCIVASSNYVINEILDARTDLDHPVKRNRPIPSGRVNLKLAYAEWILLGILGLGLAWLVNLLLSDALQSAARSVIG
jgi:4-hydroxybenzoate polyprenyltransferase